MNTGRSELLCSQCHKRVSYHILKRPANVMIKGLEIEYEEYYGICDECGNEIYVPGLDDQNEDRIEEIYRRKKELITIPEIKSILAKYHIDKRPLSKLLGLGELTITRYIDGQLPSKKYSDLLYEVLNDENRIKELAEENRDKISTVTFNKVIRTVEQYEKEKQVDNKAEKIALYISLQRKEANQSFIQRMLYYVKALSSIRMKESIIPESCIAYEDGPAFSTVHEKYKKINDYDITTNISDEYVENLLTDDEKGITRYVLHTFGSYNDWVLKKITCQEDPWKETRLDIKGNISQNIIDNQKIEKYFSRMNKKYDFTRPEGVDSYVQKMRDKVYAGEN